MASTAAKVAHDFKNLLFFIKTANARSVLEYKNLPNSVMEMYHTEVPQELQGKGYAKQLVQEAFKYAMENNLKVKPTCSYVAKYVRDMASESEKKIVIDNMKNGDKVKGGENKLGATPMTS